MNTFAYWLALQLTVMTASPLPTTAQDALDTTTFLRVYDTGDLDATEIQRVVSALRLDVAAVPMESLKHLVVRGPKAGHAELVDLLEQLLAQTQDVAKPPVDPTPIMQVYVLRHTSAQEVADTLAQALSARHSRNAAPLSIVPDVRTNSLLINATSVAHARAQGLIEQLDKPQESTSSAPETLLYTPRYRSATDLKFLANSQLTPNGHLAISQELNTLVVKDTPQAVEQIKQLLERVDVDPEPIQLDWWILGQSSEDSAPLQQTLPAIVPALQEMKLDNYGLLTRASVRSLENSPFQVNQQSPPNLVSTTPTVTSVAIRGDARLLEQGAVAMVSLECSISLSSAEQQRNPGASSQFQLSTTLKVRRGALVVVGLSPAASAQEKPLVLVLRVK